MKTKAIKLLCLIMSILMVLSLCTACGSQEEPVDADTGVGSGDSLEDMVDAPEEATEATTEETVPETKPQVLVLSGIQYTWMGKSYSLTVGKDLQLDSMGRVSSLNSDTVFLYDEAGALVRVEVTDEDDGTVGYESWTYEDGIITARVKDPNNGFHYVHDAEVSVQTDADGRVIVMEEDITYTDPEDGAKDYGQSKYEYEYDANGYVCLTRYYSDGELDHTTNLTYDENGNLLVYSNVGSSGEYLRFEFTYESVDADTVEAFETDPFNRYLNIHKLFNYIL